MAATSQNGLSVLFDNKTSGECPRLRKWIVPGTDRHLYLRDGSVGFVLVHFAYWFHRRVERLDAGTWDDWGWAVRPIRGQTSGYSNHASGSAMDLNAVQHPLGSVGTFAYRVRGVWAYARIRAHLLRYRGCIRWGGDYTGRKDEMHFEVNKPLSECELVARRLMSSPAGRRVLEQNPGAREVILS